MSVPPLALALVGLFGLLVGSFLNVVIYRLPRGESLLFPASHCPACDEPIKRRHNVPLFSWLALRGRCANCRVAISARYPAVELGTAVLYISLTLRFGLTAELPAFLYLGTIAVVLVGIDIDAKRLPDAITLPSYVVGALLLMPAGATDADWNAAERAALGLLAFGTIYLVLALSYPHALVFGDVRLAGLLGFYLGWVSWVSLLIGLVLGFVAVGFGGTMAQLVRRDGHGPAEGFERAVALPVAAPMVLTSLLALLITQPMVSWYTDLIHLA